MSFRAPRPTKLRKNHNIQNGYYSSTYAASVSKNIKNLSNIMKLAKFIKLNLAKSKISNLITSF